MAYLFLLILSLTYPKVGYASSPQPQVIGWIEKVHLVDHNVVLHAKIDTGSDGVSLHCQCKYFQRDGKTWVRFELDKEDRRILVEAKVKRFVNIRKHEGKIQKRPIIEMLLCLGEQQAKVDVNLVDRQGFNYAMLVGRSFLAGRFLVDTEKTLLTTLHCVTVK